MLRLLHHPTAAAERQWAEGAVTEVVMKRLAREKFGGLARITDDAAFAAPFQITATRRGRGVAMLGSTRTRTPSAG